MVSALMTSQSKCPSQESRTPRHSYYRKRVIRSSVVIGHARGKQDSRTSFVDEALALSINEHLARNPAALEGAWST